jgi:hypothetical protein
MTNAARENYSDFIDELGLVYVQGQELSAEDLANLCEIGEVMTSTSAWLRGDCSNLAKQFYGDDWINHINFEMNPRTLNNYGSICHKFPRERRLKSNWLKFRHYDAVKGIESEAEQDEWLRKADKDRITSDVLRQLIKESKPTITRRLNEPMQVGLIDITLMEGFGVSEGTFVRVSFEIVKAA